MKTKNLALILLLALPLTPVFAKDKAKGKAHKPDAIVHVAPSKGHKESLANVNITIGASEKDAIRGYVHSHAAPSKGKKAKAKNLPPGLAKKVARGGELPPGWQKKCIRGEILPEHIYKHCHPLPPELVVKLPAPPHGTITVAVHGKVVRLAKATREILDVFDIH